MIMVVISNSSSSGSSDANISTSDGSNFRNHFTVATPPPPPPYINTPHLLSLFLPLSPLPHTHPILIPRTHLAYRRAADEELDRQDAIRRERDDDIDDELEGRVVA